MGGIWHQAGCCCCRSMTCATCTGTQPNLEVSVEGGEDAACLAAAGSYPWDEWNEDEGACWWSWFVNDEKYLEIVLCKESGKVYAWLQNGPTGALVFGGTVAPDCLLHLLPVWREITGLVCCKLSGHLAGAFDLYGRIDRGCEGYTAHVTLGG